MYYRYPMVRNNYYVRGNRLFPGAFLVPFGLGFLTGPLFVRPRPYYQTPYYNQPYYY